VAYCFYQPGCLRHLGDGRYRKSKKDSLIASRELLRLVRIGLAHNGGRLHSRTFTERNRVYGHAHIEDAWRIYRTLAPIGIAGLGLRMRSGSYRALQEKNGGDTRAGRKPGSWLEAGGFSIRKLDARYECYPDSKTIAEYLAIQLEQAGENDAGTTLREWALQPWSLFAQSWVSAVAVKPLR
jgi:hypothetical protein